MKKIIISTAFILLSTIFLMAQNERKLNYKFSIDKIKEIVINTNGYTELENSISKNIECVLTVTEKGKVIGFSNKDELEEPEMISVIKV